MAGTDFSSRVRRGDGFVQQVDLTPALSGFKVYPENYALTGSVDLDTNGSVSGADSLYIITGGDCPAMTLTAQFLFNGKQIGSDVSISVPAQTDGKVHYTEISFTDLTFAETINLTGTIVGGDYFIFLGKKGLS